MGDHDLAIVSKIIIFLSSFSALSLFITSATGIAIVSIGALAWFGTQTAIVAGVCMVTTGIPCAIVLGLSSALSFLTVFTDVPILSDLINTSTYSWIATLILTPISLILSVFIAKLARGQ